MSLLHIKGKVKPIFKFIMPTLSAVAVLRDRLEDLPLLDESDQASLVTWLKHSNGDSDILSDSELPHLLSPDNVGRS